MASAAAHDAAPSAAADPVIRVTVRTPEQFFNSIDPSPFHERDLDESAERFILNWARDVQDQSHVELEVVITGPVVPERTVEAVAEAVHQQFRRRSDTATRELRELLRRGRISALIGVIFLTATAVAGDLIAHRVGGDTHTNQVIQEGLQLLGWVSMWRPIEIFLYGWWPLVGDRRLYDRLSRMPVRVMSPHT